MTQLSFHQSNLFLIYISLSSALFVFISTTLLNTQKLEHTKLMYEYNIYWQHKLLQTH